MTDKNTLTLIEARLSLKAAYLRSETEKRLLEALGGAERAAGSSVQEICAGCGIDAERAAVIVSAETREASRREIALAARHGIDILVPETDAYPAEFKELFDPPSVLYVKGDLPKNERRVAMVGTRHPSSAGLKSARVFASSLAASGVAVVSGLARGVDTAAHEGALDARGRTYAFLGSGLLSIYPEENASLAARISKSGALISEFALEMTPRSYNFPMRNRLISALSSAVLVVEAPKKSGALITADQALEQGREVYAVPGSVHDARAAGTNSLIKQGAFCATSYEDILAGLGWLDLPPAEAPAAEDATRFDGDPLLGTLATREALSLDELAINTGLDMRDILTRLTDYEVRGLVRCGPDRRYTLAGRS